MQAQERIKICKETRILAAQAMAEVLAENKIISEANFCSKVAKKLSAGQNLWPEGWYSPPPLGVSALFNDAEHPQRLLYDNLRKQEFWPKDNNIFAENSLGSIYASPVHKQTGIIGDFGLTIYTGKDERIQKHIKSCLEAVEETAEYAQIGMEFRELHQFCQKLMAEQGLNNNRTITYTDKVKTNIGHTVPWSYEDPTPEELSIINGTDFDKLKNLISSKRINLNEKEDFKIPPTIAFTTEFRAESNKDPHLPNASFHLIVSFVDGKKEVLGGFNTVFQATRMDFIKSKF
jgi:hypothetical protein